MAVYCLYHSPCADGMSAAYAVWRLWGDKVVYLPMNYGQHIPMMQPGSKLIFLDFVFPRPIMEDLAKQHHEIIVLDHHQTAVEQLDGIEDEYTNILTVFDKARSGAMLAWKYFHPDIREPLIFRYIEDNDLARSELPCSKEVNEVVFSYDQDFESWDGLCKRSVAQMIPEGAALLRYQAKHVKTLCEKPGGVFIQSRLVPVVNAPYFLRGECCELLLKTYPLAPFTAAYSDSGNGDRHWSLRSTDDREDVRIIAESYGGGGHRNCAAFRSRMNDVIPAFSNLEVLNHG